MIQLAQLGPMRLWPTILFAVLLLGSCGPSATEIPSPEATPTMKAIRTPTPEPLPAPTPDATPQVACGPSSSAPQATCGGSPRPTPVPSKFDEQRGVGQIEGVTFLVGQGSEATFTVREQLVDLTLPNDAVIRTTELRGTVSLDGDASEIEIDLHQLRSDQNRRDRYIRNRMFPQHPTAVFTVREMGPVPEGFIDGETVNSQVSGQLKIRGSVVPLTFEIEARDDGKVVFILAHTSFVWSDLNMTAPAATRSVVRVEDEVKVEILLAVRPLRNP